MQRDFDSPWKDAVEEFLDPLLALLFPRFHALIDWSVPYESLETELRQIVREAEVGKTIADKLFRLKARAGGDVYLLLHTEVQAQVDADFPRRMYLFSWRIGERRGEPVESLAILADDSASWRPTEYRQETNTSSTVFRFSICKLLDWKNRVEELEQMENPLGLVIVAHLQSHATHGNNESRKEWKMRLAKALLVRGLDSLRVRRLFRLIDCLLELPSDLDRQFRNELYQWEKEQTVPYISSLERLAMEEGEHRGEQKGEQKGELKGLGKGLAIAIRIKFGPAGEDLLRELQARTDSDWVSRLENELLNATSLEDLRARIG
jgi:hypothetical protein